MVNINRMPDFTHIELEDESSENDCKLTIKPYFGMLGVTLTAVNSRPKSVLLRWYGQSEKDTLVLSDAWERGYGDLGFKSMNGSQYMPWYFFAKHEDVFAGYGVMTLPDAMACWRYDEKGISLFLDTRCGCKGVRLQGRTLCLCTVVSAAYSGLSFSEASALFCRLMCPLPLLPDKPLYGGNNWYYAYGNSSYEQIIKDAKLQAELASGLVNRPFMVVDDGWQLNPCAGPWQVNERFKDMKKIADEFKKLGVRPGLWVRYLRDERKNIPPHWRLNKNNIPQDSSDFLKLPLDPSESEVLDFVKKDTEKFVLDWGYELIKHDYSTFDIFGKWGFQCNKLLCDGNWSFSDESKTSAEIIKYFYKTILDATHNKAMILGCNCISHLAAGLVHANRTGDDTSGTDWKRTRKMGVNTLAFRSCQNNTFYAADADCVGIIPGKIDKNLNLQWATLLAKSASPFFISCAYDSMPPEDKPLFQSLFETASKGLDKLSVLDATYNSLPSEYMINDELFKFDWYTGSEL